MSVANQRSTPEGGKVNNEVKNLNACTWVFTVTSPLLRNDITDAGFYYTLLKTIAPKVLRDYKKLYVSLVSTKFTFQFSHFSFHLIPTQGERIGHCNGSRKSWRICHCQSTS